MTSIRSALVTGATGFIGSALVRRLASAGTDVYCLVHASRPNRPQPDPEGRIRIVEAESLTASGLERALAGISTQVVYNLAAYGVNPRDRDPETLMDGNVGFLTRLLLATAGWDVERFVHTGSCFEYGAQPGVDLLHEELPLRPESTYAAAKVAAGVYGSALARQLGTRYVTLRLFNVFGVGEAPHRLVPYLIERLARDEEVDLTAGEQVRDLLYLDDVVDAFLLAGVGVGLVPYGTYNVCSGQPLRIRQITEAVAAVMGKPARLLHWGARPYRADEAMRIVGSNDRYVRDSGWRPTTPLHEGIRRMVEARFG